MQQQHRERAAVANPGMREDTQPEKSGWREGMALVLTGVMGARVRAEGGDITLKIHQVMILFVRKK